MLMFSRPSPGIIPSPSSQPGCFKGHMTGPACGRRHFKVTRCWLYCCQYIFVIMATSMQELSGVVRTDIAQRLSLFAYPSLQRFYCLTKLSLLLKSVGIVLEFYCNPYAQSLAKSRAAKTNASNAWLYLLIVLLGCRRIVCYSNKWLFGNYLAPTVHHCFMRFIMAFVFSLQLVWFIKSSIKQILNFRIF